MKFPGNIADYIRCHRFPSAALRSGGVFASVFGDPKTGRMAGKPVATRLALLLLSLYLMGAAESKGPALSSPKGVSKGMAAAEADKQALSGAGAPELVVQSGHARTVYYGAYSPKGDRFVTVSRDNTARLWNSNGKLLAILSEHRDRTNHVTFSSDGEMFLVASNDRSITLWSKNGKFLRKFLGHTEKVISTAFSSDNSKVVSASSDNTARVWNTSGVIIVTIEGHAGTVTSAKFSPDGSKILTASTDGSARIWDLQGKQIKRMDVIATPIRSAMYSPAGDTILTASDDGLARIWTTDGKLHAILKGHSGKILDAIFAPDGRQVLTASNDKKAILWSIEGKLLQVLEGHETPVAHVEFSTNGSEILTISDSNIAKIWQKSGRLKCTMGIRSDSFMSGHFSPNGKTILITTEESTVQIWNNSCHRQQILESVSVHTYSANFSPDGRKLAVGMWGNNASFWEVQANLLINFQAPIHSIYSAIFSSDGKTIFTNSGDRIGIWAADGKLMKFIDVKGTGLNSVDVSPDGLRILTAHEDKIARVWSISGELLLEIKGHTERIVSAKFSPDGHSIITASWDKTARIWGNEGQHIRTFLNSEAYATKAIFSPDNLTVIVGYMDGNSRVWSIKGNILYVLRGHSEPVSDIVFSLNGETIMTASKDHTARIFSKGGQYVGTIKHGSEMIQQAIFSPNGKLIFTIQNTSINIWSVKTQALLGTIMFIREPFSKKAWFEYTLASCTGLITTPDGRFDYTDKRALEYVSYRVGEKFVDLQEVHDYYYTPGLLKMVLDDTLPANETGGLDKKLKKLPDIQILSPGPEDVQDKVMERKLKFAFRVKDTGGGVAKAAVRVKGKLVWESVPGADLGTMQEIDLTLDGGTNQVSVTAYNRAGGPHTETIDLKCADVDLKKQAKLFILSVGVNEYNQNPLTYSVADAKKVVENFEKQSKPFFKEVIPIALYDKDATLGRIQKEIKAIKDNAGPDDLVMLYFSGHGLSVKEESGKKLFGFIPQDYPWRGDEATTLRRFGLTHDYLANQVKGMKPTKVVIIMDACHSGDAQLAFAKSAENNDREILEKLANGTGVFMLTSSAGKQLSREDPTIGHGIFTYVLLEGLADKAADVDGDGVVSIKELSGYMTARFESRAQKIMGKNFVQTPVINSMGRSEASAAALDFPLARVK